jgi:hypothetical protein
MKKTTFAYLLIFFLTAANILFTAKYSIAQSSNNRTQNAERIQNSPNASTSPIIKVDTAGAIEDNNYTLWLWSASSLLHLLEIASIIFAFLYLSKLKNKNIKNSRDLKSLQQKFKTYEANQENQFKSVSSVVEKIYSPTPVNETHQQQSYGVSSYSSLSNEQPGFESGKLKPLAKPVYPCLDKYRQSIESFKNQYSPSVVSEEAENFQKRWSGSQQEIILGENRQGNYWIFNEDSSIYLVPSPKLKVNDMTIRTARGLFDLYNFRHGYGSITIIEPAIVSVLPGANQRWKLEHQGVLEFT